VAAQIKRALFLKFKGIKKDLKSENFACQIEVYFPPLQPATTKEIAVVKLKNSEEK